MITHIYSDGGLVHCSPSPYGGTWAWRAGSSRRLNQEYFRGAACSPRQRRHTAGDDPRSIGRRAQ